MNRAMHELAIGAAPRLFAIVEQYDDPKEIRVAGYGLAYEDRAEVNSVEGDFRLTSDSSDHARTVFEISSKSAGVRRAHVIWLDGTRSTQPNHRQP
ncbi:hypothetical protein LZG04_23610 [Saccharothrix sp. S26]|uniref:hypothetical protein n=1 Tax=Saccharothrix sp. S26 TaxID=2907215 RepID=UPI001F253867|nr:hypothetical protein [Saccharothrix sp. S26]MCE6997765.1 hypothetical protein [Saccharothrix sp. S26]